MVNPRQEMEREKARKLSAGRSKAAQARWKQEDTTNAMQMQCKGSTTSYDTRYASVYVSESSSPKTTESFQFDDWVAAILKRHPNKRNPQLGIQYLTEKSWLGDANARAEFDETHSAWCKSDLWLWANGAKCPELAEFVRDYELSYRAQRPPEKAGDDW
jgi:hypothetical protein